MATIITTETTGEGQGRAREGRQVVFESPVRSGFLLPKQWTETGTGLYQFKDCKRLH